jgi:cupin 2 domain-containing protein
VNLPQGNLFAGSVPDVDAESVTRLLVSPEVTIERIVSAGQASPPGFWYDQDRDEWVLLLTGSAGLLIENEAEIRTLNAGDYLAIPAHLRHRVEWTAPDQATVWLAVHYRPGIPERAASA